MAKGSKTGGRDFQENHGKPGPGRPTVPDDIREARKLNRAEFERVVNKFLFVSRSDLSAFLKRTNSTVIELLVGSLIEKAIQQGDYLRLNFILDRLVGKTIDRVEIRLPKPCIIHRLNGGQVVLGATNVDEAQLDEGISFA